MADITKSSGDGATVSSHVLNGPATKEPTLKYSPQDPGLMKESMSGPVNSVSMLMILMVPSYSLARKAISERMFPLFKGLYCF